MAPKFDCLRSVLPKREAYRFRVRVVRLWLVPGFVNPAQPMSMEMIFMDEYGDKIQATVRKSLLYKFSEVLKEGKVYRFAYFGVVPNTGSYKATDHEYKLLFQLRTTATESDSSTIPIFGVTPLPFGIVTKMEQESDNLIDVMGVLTGISTDREYLREGKVIKMVVMELSDTQLSTYSSEVLFRRVSSKHVFYEQ